MNLVATAGAILVLLAGRSVLGQAAKIEHQPLLAPITTKTACTKMSINLNLKKGGIETGVMMLQSARVLSLYLSADGKPTDLEAMVGRSERTKSESVKIHFDPNGRVVRGYWMEFIGGVPARLSTDPKSGLLPTDTAEAIALVRAIRANCHL